MMAGADWLNLHFDRERRERGRGREEKGREGGDEEKCYITFCYIKSHYVTFCFIKSHYVTFHKIRYHSFLY